MRLVDGDGNSVDLPSGVFTKRTGPYKYAQHDYLFSDDTDLTFMGRGPVSLGVSSLCTTEELEDIALFVSRGEEMVLWFTQDAGERYYQRVVATSDPSPQSATGILHTVALALLALDPHVYDADGQAVT